jgi:hypothetical protein
MQLRQVDELVIYAQHRQEDSGRVVLINQSTVAPEDAGRFLEAWPATRPSRSSSRASSPKTGASQTPTWQSTRSIPTAERPACRYPE